MERHEELDSIRGISSLVVMIGHYLMIFSAFQNYSYEDNKPFVVYLLKETPARLIFSSGNESVIIFFVLSGFVLYESIKKQIVAMDHTFKTYMQNIHSIYCGNSHSYYMPDYNK